MRLISCLIILAILFVTTPFTFALNNSVYEAEMLVKDGKKSKELNSTLTFRNNSFTIAPNKDKYKGEGKTFDYGSISAADYSFSKKPLLSTGGSVATVILLGIAALPFLFMKKKRHWLTVRNESEFAVIKLQKSNFRQVLAEFETHKVKINTVEEDENEDKENQKKNQQEKADQVEGKAESTGKKVDHN
jgi:hypothetical protein